MGRATKYLPEQLVSKTKKTAAKKQQFYKKWVWKITEA